MRMCVRQCMPLSSNCNYRWYGVVNVVLHEKNVWPLVCGKFWKANRIRKKEYILFIAVLCTHSLSHLYHDCGMSILAMLFLISLHVHIIRPPPLSISPVSDLSRFVSFRWFECAMLLFANGVFVSRSHLISVCTYSRFGIWNEIHTTTSFNWLGISICIRIFRFLFQLTVLITYRQTTHSMNSLLDISGK